MRASNYFATAPLADLRVLRKAAVIEIVGMSGENIRLLEGRGQFPRRIVLGENSVGWLEKEVREWLAARSTIASAKPIGARAPHPPPVKGVRKIAAKKARGGPL